MQKSILPHILTSTSNAVHFSWRMQFARRITVVVILAMSVFLLTSLWHTQFTDEDRQAKILRILATLEAHMTEWEAGVRSLQKKILIKTEPSVPLGGLSHAVVKGADVGLRGESNLQVPSRAKAAASTYTALPYPLAYLKEALVPALTVGRQREGVSFVLGVPTVRRPNQSYLIPTLRSLVTSMLPWEKSSTLIVVFVAESNVSLVQTTVNSITKRLSKDVGSGLIEIVAPPASYYPDLKTIRGTVGDSDERTRWRTKQILDYAYLMMYALRRGLYYVQLEDDVLSKKGFINTMRDFVLDTSIRNKDWFMLDFSQLGFIGKLFRSSELWKLVEFFLLFSQDKPIDWLLSHFFSVKYCRLDYSQERCNMELKKRWIHYKPSLFQHVGTVSSLEGKVQKLQDWEYVHSNLFTRHDNPKAKVESSISHYEDFSLEGAYKGKNYFWGLAPEAGDRIKFTLDHPARLVNYKFVSGNAEHPSDKVCSATLEVLPAEPGIRVAGSTSAVTSDGYYVVDEFDELGILEGRFPDYVNPVKAVRITMKSSSKNWVILSEILLEEPSTKYWFDLETLNFSNNQ